MMDLKIEEIYTLQLDADLDAMIYAIARSVKKPEQEDRAHKWIKTLTDVQSYINVAKGKNRIAVEKIADVEKAFYNAREYIRELEEKVRILEETVKFNEENQG
jgi:hypothetical protein